MEEGVTTPTADEAVPAATKPSKVGVTFGGVTTPIVDEAVPAATKPNKVGVTFGATTEAVATKTGKPTSLTSEEEEMISKVSFGESDPDPVEPDPGAAARKLSSISKMYDIDGDGQLDEAELAMRAMDTSGRGYLTNEKVFGLMQDQMEQQRQLFKFKKIMIGLAVMVFLLTLSNLGTSFAAAYLAKDTTVNEKQELVNSDTKDSVSTQTTSKKYSVGPLPEGEAGRRLDTFCVNNTDCDTELGEGGYILTENNDVERGRDGSCQSIATQCKDKKTVDIFRTFASGEQVTIPLCSSVTKVVENPAKGLYTFRSPSVPKIYMQMLDNGCKFSGDELTQEAGEVCDGGNDCRRKHKCYQKSAAMVESCVNRDCVNMNRNNRISCEKDCGGNTCELITSSLVQSGKTLGPTNDGPNASSAPSESPTLSSAPSKSSHPTRSPASAPPCPPPFDSDKDYDDGNNESVTCGGEVGVVIGPNCDASKKTGVVWYYNGKRWKFTGLCTENGFVGPTSD